VSEAIKQMWISISGFGYLKFKFLFIMVYFYALLFPPSPLSFYYFSYNSSAGGLYM